MTAIAEPSLSRLDAATGFALFLLIGAVAASFGPVVPSYRLTFAVSAAAAGLLPSGHFAGAVIGILSPNVLGPRARSPRPFAVAGTAIFGLGCVVLGLAPNPTLAILGAVVEGIGWGAVVICFNTLFASGFGSRSSAMLTLLNATYGIGAIGGPAAVGLLFAGKFHPPFLAAAALALVVLPFVLSLPAQIGITAAPAGGNSQPRSGGSYPRLLVGFLAAFFLLGGLEGGIGAWEATQLVAVGFSAASAATITSLFWMTYTASRLVIAPLSLRVPAQRTLLVAIGAVFLLFLVTRVANTPAIIYTIAGLAIGPLFPMALLWSNRVLASAHRATSFVIASDLFGGIIVSAALGKLVSVESAASLPLAFAAIAGASLAICFVLANRSA